MNHTLPNLTLPPLRPLKPIRMALIIKHSLINLLLRIHNKGPILHHLLVERQSRHKHKLAIFFGIFIHCGSNRIAFLLEHDVVVLADGRTVAADAEGGGAAESIGEGVPARRVLW